MSLYAREMAKITRPILVTGSHRSGSTWVGQTLGASPSLHYIHEPFNVESPPGRAICGTKFTTWFTYITRQNEDKYYQPIKCMVNSEYHVLGALQDEIPLKEALERYDEFRAYRSNNVRPIIKDPIAVFSAEWLAERFDVRVIVMIRHPAAFVSSLKRLKWQYNFRNFLCQPSLMADWLHPFEHEIHDYVERKHDIVDQGVLLWKCIYHVVSGYRERHPDWLFIRHEDLSRNPRAEFRSLFSQLGVEFSSTVDEFLTKHSNSSNPSYALGRDATMKLNSRANISSWRTRLTREETHRVRRGAEEVSCGFYSDEDWK